MPSLRMRIIEFLLGVLLGRNMRPGVNVRGLRSIDASKPPPLPGRSNWTAGTTGNVNTWTFKTPLTETSRPPIVFLHGGAHVSGPHAGHYMMLAALCKRTGRTGLLPVFRLAPEHPFPAGFDDVNRLLDALPGNYSLAGDSAGGGLALSVTDRRAKQGKSVPDRLVAFAPWLDVTMSNPQAEQVPDRVLTCAGLREAGIAYAGETLTEDPRISPMHADTGNLPPILIDVGTHDRFLPDCRSFAQRLKGAGSKVTLHEQPGAFHVYAGAYPLTPESVQSIGRAARFLG